MHALENSQQPEISILLPKKVVAGMPITPVRRSKIWELDKRYHCPVIGLCLPQVDLECFARRFHFNTPISNTYALHVEAVCCVTSRNAVSEAIHKHLDRLHQNHIKQFVTAKTDNEVLMLWKTYFSSGKIAGPLWAALTHKRISSESGKQIYHMVHMHMHEAVAELSATQNRPNQTEQTLKELIEQLKQAKEKHAQTELRLRQRLEQAAVEIRELQQSRREDDTLRQRLETLESGRASTEMAQRLMRLTTENEQLQIRIAQVDGLKQSLKSACHSLAKLYRERDALHTERNALEKLLLTFNSGNAIDTESTDVVDTDADSFDCILCVGGRPALLPQYRALARRLGLKLLHHDGGQENALSRLPEMVYGATAVICPTDCVSHAAYYQIKRLCRLGRKPCLLFKGAGVSSFAAALAKIASGETSINSGSGKLPETTT